MTLKTLPTHFRRWGALGALALGLGLTGCNSVLDVDDPDIIIDANSASGAIALRNGVLLRFSQATSGGESLFLMGGLLSDEWISGDTFEQRNTTDAREVLVTNSFLGGQLRGINRVRVEGRSAINALREFAPTPAANIGLMFAVGAFTTNLAGEHYCNGIPFSSLDENRDIIFGTPVTVDETFTLAIQLADSALQFTAGDGGADVTGLASVVKGRALLNQGNFAAAAAAVAGVSTDFEYKVTHSLNVNSNQNWSLNTSARRYVVGNLDGGNGLDFVAADDPRLPAGPSGGPNAFDSQTPFRAQFKWGRTDPVVVASGIEARLIEAEAALQAGDAATWLSKLNEARATLAGLDPLTDPGSTTAREDLLFRERAFWMFGTGHRLGDLRRLIRQYGRGSETVFPTGAFPKGGSFGGDVNLPISQDETNNPNFSQCLDRNA